MNNITKERYIGCLLGGAVGDALGMAVIGRSAEEIASMGGVTEFSDATETASVIVPVNGVAESELGDLLTAGQWTDDTQLTLLMAEMLLEEGMFVPEAWAHKLVYWLNNEPRGPGLSTLQAAMELRSADVFWDEVADPDGAGCGAATRVAPLALFYLNHAPLRQETTILQAQVTHGSLDAYASAFAVCEAIVLALNTEVTHWNGQQLLSLILNRVRNYAIEFEPFANCLQLALNLLEDNVPPTTAIRVLGNSAWCREAIPTALYLVAKFGESYEQMVLNAVNLTGNATESIATIVGAIGGALHGVEGIPILWRTEVEDVIRIVQIAEQLFDFEV